MAPWSRQCSTRRRKPCPFGSSYAGSPPRLWWPGIDRAARPCWKLDSPHKLHQHRSMNHDGARWEAANSPLPRDRGGAYHAPVSVKWTKDEHHKVAQAIADHGLESRRCAAVARVVYGVAKPKDAAARGIQMQAPPGARWMIPKKPRIPQWNSHTYVETQEHAVDAVTGPDGYAAATYRTEHWNWSETFVVCEVDVATVDPGIEDIEDET